MTTKIENNKSTPLTPEAQREICEKYIKERNSCPLQDELDEQEVYGLKASPTPEVKGYTKRVKLLVESDACKNCPFAKPNKNDHKDTTTA